MKKTEFSLSFLLNTPLRPSLTTTSNPFLLSPLSHLYLQAKEKEGRKTSMSPPLYRRRMEVPNMEMIETSLRRCSLNHHHHIEAAEAVTTTTHLHFPPPLHGCSLDPSLPAEITVDLNSDVPLPYPWEQYLNIQNGEVYYVNKIDGTKTARDPRHRLAAVSDSDSEPESGVEDDVGDEDDEEDEGDLTRSDESTDWSDKKKDTTPSTSSSSSSISTASSCSTACSRAKEKDEASDGYGYGDGDDEREEISNGGVLVLVGCQVCFTLSMVAQPAMKCGKCGSAALRHF